MQSTLVLFMVSLVIFYIHDGNVFRMEDFDAEEEDEEALIEKRRQQRLAIMQVGKHQAFHLNNRIKE